MAKLKVFRTPIGFHDAYVAAPSQKAALAAWGADADLFARGIAEKVDDAELTRDPLSKPGQVIRVKRGTDAEHFQALPKRSSSPSQRGGHREPSPKKTASSKAETAKPTKVYRPRPNRAPVERAEAAIEDAETLHREALKALEKRERALKEERKRLASAHERTLGKLTAARDDALTSYHRRLEEWADEE